MIPVPAGVRVWLASGVTDMRRGMNTLALQVQEDLGRDPHAGDLYIFRGRRGDLVKILWSDGVGTSLYASAKGVNEAAAMGATLDTAACFYREDGPGTNAITGALGRALLRGIRAKFSSGFLDEYAIGRPDGNVVIRSETIRDSV